MSAEKLKKNHLYTIIDELCSREVKFIICGGVASVLHGVERMTLDLDISVELSRDNVRRLSEAMENLGLKSRVPVPIEILGDPDSVKMIVEEKNAVVFSLIDPDLPYKHIDIFLREDLSFQALEEYAVEKDIADRRVKVLSMEKLLSLKKAIAPPRDKDKQDIAELSRLIDRK